MTPAINDLMKELRSEYIESLPQKIADIRANMTESDTDQWTTQFHKLKGSGKTYGLPEVSELGAIMEKICKSSNSPTVREAVIIAAELLEAISEHRSSGQEFSLAEDTRYKKLASISN